MGLVRGLPGDAARRASRFLPSRSPSFKASSGSFFQNKNQRGTMSENTDRPVLVTTEYRGVFFGYASDTSGDTITLKRARNCIYWPSGNGGFGGLAAEGPAKGARIVLRVAKIMRCTVSDLAETFSKGAQE